MPTNELTTPRAPDDVRELEHVRDEVYDAALESFPASDAPSWGALRVGAPYATLPDP